MKINFKDKKPVTYNLYIDSLFAQIKQSYSGRDSA